MRGAPTILEKPDLKNNRSTLVDSFLKIADPRVSRVFQDPTACRL